MHLQNRLEQYIQEYLDETDKSKNQLISIVIPGHKCRFMIIDSFKLTLHEPEQGFTLCIYHSLSNKTKIGKKLNNRINETGLFKGYIKMDGKQNTTFYKLTNNNPQAIAIEIETIINTLYGEVDSDKIEIEVKKTHSWFTLEE